MSDPTPEATEQIMAELEQRAMELDPEAWADLAVPLSERGITTSARERSAALHVRRGASIERAWREMPDGQK